MIDESWYFARKGTRGQVWLAIDQIRMKAVNGLDGLSGMSHVNFIQGPARDGPCQSTPVKSVEFGVMQRE